MDKIIIKLAKDLLEKLNQSNNESSESAYELKIALENFIDEERR